MGHSSPIRVQGICPSDPTRFPLVIFYVGDDFLVQKLLSCLFICLTIIMFAQVFSLFFRYAFPWNSDDLSVMAFFLQLHFMLIFTSLLRLILSFNFPWYFPEKSGNICFIFRHVSFNIQWILFVFKLFVELSNLYSFIYSFISLFICLTFLSCSAIHYIYFVFLLNCANSVLCAV